MMRNSRIVIGAGFLAFMAMPVAAQYSLDMTEAYGKEPHIRYFGTAKDDKGRGLEDVTILLQRESASYVFITNAGGRFSGSLPVKMSLNAVTPRCVKTGFQTVRISKRANTVGNKHSAEIDCILRRAGARS